MLHQIASGSGAEEPACLSILVNSCDSYSDVWPLFFSCFWKYWPNCPYPVYLGSNSVSYGDPRVRPLLIGDDLGWATSTLRMVQRIASPYILLFVDDDCLIKPVESSAIESSLDALKALDGGYLRLRPLPPPNRPIPSHSAIGLIAKTASYRCALQPSIWKRQLLMDLLKEGETPWGMEIYGSIRSRDMTDAFYCTWPDLLKCNFNAVIDGKWHPSALRLADREGVRVDFTRRPVLTRTQSARIRAITSLYFLNRILPEPILSKARILLRILRIIQPPRRLLARPAGRIRPESHVNLGREN